jgi:hypothetical protein
LTAFTDDLFGHHATDDDTVIVFPVSRLMVDPKRFLDDMQEMMAWVGMGAIHTNPSSGEPLREIQSLEDRDTLIQRYYVTHHKQRAGAHVNRYAPPIIELIPPVPQAGQVNGPGSPHPALSRHFFDCLSRCLA